MAIQADKKYKAILLVRELLLSPPRRAAVASGACAFMRRRAGINLATYFFTVRYSSSSFLRAALIFFRL